MDNTTVQAKTKECTLEIRTTTSNKSQTHQLRVRVDVTDRQRLKLRNNPNIEDFKPHPWSSNQFLALCFKFCICRFVFGMEPPHHV
eukprot:4900778-Amphidinium_carterae.1